MAPRNSAASRSASAPPAAIPPTAFPLPANRPPLRTRPANRPQPATSATRNLSPTSPSAAGSKHRQAGQSGNSPPPRRYRTTGLQSGRQTITAADPPPRRPPAGPRNHQPRQLTCVLGWPNSGGVWRAPVRRRVECAPLRPPDDRAARRPRSDLQIGMVPGALATLDFVAHDDAQPTFRAVHLEGRTLRSYGELVELVGESERVLRHDSKALALRAGERSLPRCWPISPRCADGTPSRFCSSRATMNCWNHRTPAPSPGCSSRPSGHASTAGMGIWPTRCASSSADRR